MIFIPSLSNYLLCIMNETNPGPMVAKESTHTPSSIFFFIASISFFAASFTNWGSFLHLVAATTIDVIIIKMTTDETDAIMIFCFLVKFLMSNLDFGGLWIWFSILEKIFTFGFEASDSTSKMKLLERGSFR